MLDILRNIRLGLLHIFLPKTCLCCGCDLPWKDEGFLCSACREKLSFVPVHICKRCGVTLPSGGAHCFACRGSKAKKYKCSLIRSAFVFNEASRSLVHGLKYDGREYLAAVMGKEMALRFKHYPELASSDLIMPVPLFAKRKRKRGYNQSELLAQSFSLHTGISCDVFSLVRIRDTVSQTRLGRKARLENMAGAFMCNNINGVEGKTVLLIDDVATTGATLEGCATALKRAGAKKVFAYTFARE